MQKCQKIFFIFFRFKTFCIFSLSQKKTPLLVTARGLAPPPAPFMDRSITYSFFTPSLRESFSRNSRYKQHPPKTATLLVFGWKELNLKHIKIITKPRLRISIDSQVIGFDRRIRRRKKYSAFHKTLLYTGLFKVRVGRTFF